MPKNSDILGILFLLVILNKKSNIFYDLHRLTETLNRLDNLSSTMSSIPDITSMAQKIGPMLSMLNNNSLQTYDDIYEENRNAIF